MTDFKLKINLGEASIELEGEAILVKEILNDLKETGLGVLTKVATNQNDKASSIDKCNAINNTNADVEEVSTESTEYPSLKDLMYNDSIKSESDIIIVFVHYLSSFGQNVVGESAIKENYQEFNLWKKARSNFKTNIKKLIRAKKMSSVDSGYILTQKGKDDADAIIFGRQREKETKKDKINKSTKNNFTNYQTVELNLTREDKAELIKLYSNKEDLNTIDKVLLASHWYKNNRQETIINKDIVFTILRNANVSTAFSIQDALGNAKKKNYYSKTGKAGEFEFSYLGEDYVTEHLLIQE